MTEMARQRKGQKHYLNDITTCGVISVHNFIEFCKICNHSIVRLMAIYRAVVGETQSRTQLNEICLSVHVRL